MSPTTTEMPMQETPVETELTLAGELQALEEQALQLGMSQEEFLDSQQLGDCQEQIQQRIAMLRTWIDQKCN